MVIAKKPLTSSPVIKPVVAVAPSAAVLPASKSVAKSRAKSAAKPAAKKAKPLAKPASKPVLKPSAKVSTKTATKIATKAPANTVAKPKAAKPVKAKKPKLVRDSFTIPKAEYTVLDELKARAGKLANPAKKSELLRAGIKALAAMSDVAFLGALKAVPTIKTGRPTKS